MAQGLAGKVALVTGAARGIGRAIALRLARDGASLIVNYSGSAQQAQETVGLIEQGGGRAAAVQADVSKVGDVKRLFDACTERFGRLDILVNNAGVMFTKPVVEVGEGRCPSSILRSSVSTPPAVRRGGSSSPGRA